LNRAALFEDNYRKMPVVKYFNEECRAPTPAKDELRNRSRRDHQASISFVNPQGEHTRFTLDYHRE